MPEDIRAAIARQLTVSPRDARTFAGMTQHQWAEWFGVSVATVHRSEDDGKWSHYPTAADRTVSLWLAMFGPEPEAAFRAVGRLALTPDIRNATDGIFIQATKEMDNVEAAIRRALAQSRLETT